MTVTICPYCGAWAANTQQEVAHMQQAHPEVIEKRLSNAGFVQEEPGGPWIDALADPDA